MRSVRKVLLLALTFALCCVGARCAFPTFERPPGARHLRAVRPSGGQALGHLSPHQLLLLDVDPASLYDRVELFKWLHGSINPIVAQIRDIGVDDLISGPEARSFYGIPRDDTAEVIDLFTNYVRSKGVEVTDDMLEELDDFRMAREGSTQFFVENDHEGWTLIACGLKTNPSANRGFDFVVASASFAVNRLDMHAPDDDDVREAWELIQNLLRALRCR